ncbi:MAG: Na(+)-translocating NADH-quinone reductase subunit C [Pseudomonadota bacterium]
MIRKLLALPNEDTRKVIFVALTLCLVCASVVSAAAVMLRPLQDANSALDRKKNILVAAGLLETGAGAEPERIEALFAERVETRLVDLQSGEFDTSIEADSFDPRAAALDPERSLKLDKSEDIAGIGRRAKLAPVYLVRDDRGDLDQLVIPVHGYGLWSTMYGYLSLRSDLNTVAGITFYEHGETPGLGGEIENPAWQALWVDKQVYGTSGAPELRVIKGAVPAGAAGAEHQVDGISGSTLTGKGVSNLVTYWLGDSGFGPFLERIRETGV